MPFGISLGGAALIAGGLGAAGAVATGIMQSNTASDAQDQSQQQFQQQQVRADQQQVQADKRFDQQQARLDQQLAQQRADTAPWRTAGQQSLTASADLLGLNGPDAAAAAMDNFQQSPGYQWSMDQGMRAVDAGAAARGMLRSGATLKAEQTFGAGLADQEFGNYYSRLAGLSTLGENAAAGGAANAQGAASAALQGANAQNSIYGSTASALGGTANKLLTDPAFQNWLNPPSPAVNTTFSGFAPARTFDATASSGWR